MKKHAYLLLIFLAACGQENTKTGNSPNSEPARKQAIPGAYNSNAGIIPPFESFDVEFQTFRLSDLSKAQHIELPSGAKIIIPKNSIVDQNGKAPAGQVEIKFREIHTPAEIIASGIPMIYDSAGTRIDFETAGMFEIRAYSNGEALNVAPGNALMVEIKSNKGDKDFNFYQLNETSKNWKYESTCTPRPNPDKKEIKNIEYRISKIEKPSKPVKYTPGDKIFDLKMDFNEHSEYTDLASLMWKYAGSSPENDPFTSPKFFEHKWNMVQIIPSQNIDGAYEIKLEKENDTVTFSTTAVPVYRGKTLDKANKKFTELLSKYNEEIGKLVEEKEKIKREADFVRTMQVKGFGIYNFDRQLKFEQTIPLLASIDFDKKIAPGNFNVYLIVKSTNSCVCYTPQTISYFRFDPDTENSMIAVLPGNKIAVFTDEDFRALDVSKLKSAGKHTFKLKVQDKKLNNIQDLNDRLASI